MTRSTTISSQSDGDYAKAESFLLRAHKPEIIVKSYKELGVCA